MKIIGLILTAACFATAAETNWYQGPQGQSQTSVYDTNLKLRKDRKLGVGAGIGGALGGLGGIVELNIEDENAAVATFGSGSGYQTFGLAWKRSFEGEYFTPYTTAGYSHWWGSGNNRQANRSAILRNFISDADRARNFGLDLLTGTVGMQYNQLAGELAGSSFYIEFGGLLNLSDTKILPTGSIGVLYYF
jgi:hypothetical protein